MIQENKRISIPTITIDGIPIHNLTEKETANWIIHEIQQQKGGMVVTVNMDHLYRASINPDYRELLLRSDLVVADGTPIIWLSKLQGTPLKERVAGSSLISTLSQQAAQQGLKVFLLGGNKGTAELAAKVLLEGSPSLSIGGTYFPEMGFEHSSEEMHKIKELLIRTKPDIIFVALGSPKQEQLISVLKYKLPNVWWLGVGISFSYLAKEMVRAPVIIQRMGLEWAYRLYQEPKRLWKRYLLHDIPYGLRISFQSLALRFRGFF